MTSPSAEAAYLFRHALLRDAAYEMQLPSDRAKLHELAFYLIERAFGGRAPTPTPLEAREQPAFVPYVSDRLAYELAEHARLAGGDESVHHLADARALYLQRAAEYAEARFMNDAAITAWFELAGVLAETAQAQALRRAGVRAIQSGRVGIAEDAFARALAIHREIGNRNFEGLVLSNLGGVYRETGRIELAESTYDQALSLHHETDDRRNKAVTLQNLALLYAETGRMENAERAYLEAISLADSLGNIDLSGVVYGNLANCYRVARRLDEAETAYTNALAILRKTGNRRSEGIVMTNMAGLYSLTGRNAEAEATHNQALAIHREAGNRRFEGVTLGNLAGIYSKQNRVRQAEDSYPLALAIHREVGNRRLEGAHLCEYGLHLLSMARLGDARDYWRRGAAILHGLNDKAELQRKSEAMRNACAEANVPPFDA